MLSADRAVVIQGRAAPVIVHIEQVRRRADYKRRKQQQLRSLRAALPAPRQVPEVTPAHPSRAPIGLKAAGELTFRLDDMAGLSHVAEEVGEEAQS